jgi:DnaB-like helicase C terminal domain
MFRSSRSSAHGECTRACRMRDCAVVQIGEDFIGAITPSRDPVNEEKYAVPAWLARPKWLNSPAVSNFSRRNSTSPWRRSASSTAAPNSAPTRWPQLWDLRESGQIENDADMVILLHLPDAFDRDSPRAGEADLIVANQRSGPAPVRSR